MFSPKQKFGREIEELARAYLLEAGLRCVNSNYSCSAGEIDLVMQDNDTLVFVEVRYRQDDDYGGAVASITKSKQRKIIHAAKTYLQEQNLWDKVVCRFDVLVVQDGCGCDHGARQIHWLKDAFWVSGW